MNCVSAASESTSLLVAIATANALGLLSLVLLKTRLSKIVASPRAHARMGAAPAKSYA